MIINLKTDEVQKERWAELQCGINGIYIRIHGTHIGSGSYLISYVYFARTLGL